MTTDPAVVATLGAQQIELPSWAFGNSGTRFKVYAQRGVSRTPQEKIADTGHHPPGTNIEFVVAALLRAGRLGGFDFNSRFYADDDLMFGSADPFQLFRIMWEVVAAGGLSASGYFERIVADRVGGQAAGWGA